MLKPINPECEGMILDTELRLTRSNNCYFCALMKRGVKFLLSLMTIVFLQSCISYKKNLILRSDQAKFPEASLKTNDSLDYKLRVSDVIYVEVNRLYLGDEVYALGDHVRSQITGQQLNPYIMGLPINENGVLTIPLIGDFNAIGLTLDELTEQITQQAKQVYSTVSVKTFLLTQNITVLGEVPRSGRFQYYTENISIFDAIALAGGFTDFSDRENVKIIRDQGETTEILHVNLNDLSHLDASKLMLQNNDVLVLSPQKRKRLVTNNNFNVVLSSVTVLVTVLSLLISLNSR